MQHAFGTNVDFDYESTLCSAAKTVAAIAAAAAAAEAAAAGICQCCQYLRFLESHFLCCS
jgi:hypothetical protein